MLWVKAFFFLLVLPGTVIVWLPWYFLHAGFPRFDPGPARWAGGAMAVVGIVAELWCVWDFAKIGRGTLAPVDPPKSVVRRGLYGYLRNPMYVAVVAAVAGEALFFGVWAMVIEAGILATMFGSFVVFYEEPELRKTFGASYEEYCRDVPRWIPRFGRRG